jgi:hypothetical protein
VEQGTDLQGGDCAIQALALGLEFALLDSIPLDGVLLAPVGDAHDPVRAGDDALLWLHDRFPLKWKAQ